MSNPDILNIAHRGASGHAPENTMASFMKAIEMGADGIELDVQLTADNQIVVFHDEDLKRTSNLKGRLAGYTFDQLKQADAGSWFAPEFTNERIPLLEDVLELVKNKLILDIEIKYHTPDDLLIIIPLLDMLKELKFLDFIISSFSLEAILRVKELAPHIATGFIFSKASALKHLDLQQVDYLCPKFNLITDNKIDFAEKRLWTWTVNKESDIELLADSGVEAIITNYPDLVKKFI